MAHTLIAQISTAQVVGVPYGDPADVESDTTAAPQGTVNIHIPPTQGISGFLTLEPTAAATVGALSNGACTIIISQGADTFSVTTTA